MHTMQNRALQQNVLKDLTIILINIFVDELIVKMLGEPTKEEFTNMLKISKNFFCEVIRDVMWWGDIKRYNDVIYDA